MMVNCLIKRVDVYTGTQLARDAVILFFIANDGLSIVENLGIMGVPIPPAIQNAFAALKGKAETAPENEKDP